MECHFKTINFYFCLSNQWTAAFQPTPYTLPAPANRKTHLWNKTTKRTLHLIQNLRLENTRTQLEIITFNHFSVFIYRYLYKEMELLYLQKRFTLDHALYIVVSALG